MRRTAALSLLLILLTASIGSAQEWARKMFSDTSHDFGKVAKGAKVQHRFKFKNIYEEPIHVASVRSSCGCTSVDITKRDLKTWETSEVIANFNTNAFLGHHSATLTVTIDKPYYAEVQLQVYGNIRHDIVLQPGSVELGSIDAGKTAEKAIAITHTGRGDWKILDVRSANTNFEVEANERQRNHGNVTYDLIVRLKGSAPPGYINDQLFLITNDSMAPQIPVDVEGRVVAPIQVNPSSLSLGSLKPGQTVTKHVVVRGNKPFKVLGVDCEDCIQVDLPKEARNAQAIPITFTAGDKPGKVVKKIKIRTDMGDNILPEVTCLATIEADAQGPAPTASAPPTSAPPGSTPPADQSKAEPATAGFRGK